MALKTFPKKIATFMVFCPELYHAFHTFLNFLCKICYFLVPSLCTFISLGVSKLFLWEEQSLFWHKMYISGHLPRPGQSGLNTKAVANRQQHVYRNDTQSTLLCNFKPWKIICLVKVTSLQYLFLLQLLFWPGVQKTMSWRWCHSRVSHFTGI